MKFRYKIEELENVNSESYLTDLKLLRSLVIERQEDCTNVYAPLYKRLQRLYNTLSKGIDNNKPIEIS